MLIRCSGFTPQYKGASHALASSQHHTEAHAQVFRPSTTSTRTEASSSSASPPTRCVRRSPVVIVRAHPLVQFGAQEPGTDDEIATFCERNHGVSFPLMKKSDVNGDDANEVFKFLKNQKAGLLGLTRIKVRRPSFCLVPRC